MKTTRLPYLFFLLALILAACGGNSAPESTTATADEGTPAPSDGGTTATEIVIRPVGNELRFEQTAISVEAGQQVTLVLENVADSPAMIHNIVVLNSNEDDVVNRVGMTSVTAGEANNFVPDDEAVLASTPLARPGETVRVTFTAPSEPGNYRYICTYIGHYVAMQGTMTVS